MKRRLAAVLAGLLAAGCSLAAGPEREAAASLRRFDALKVGVSSVAVKDLKLEAGHAIVTLRSGQIAPVRAGEEVIGLFFQGAGALEYRSVDPVEFPISTFEARKTTGLSPERSGSTLVLRDTFATMLWLSAGRPIPELPGGSELWKPSEARVEASVAAGASLEAAFRTHRESFARVQTHPVSHLFAARAANAPSGPLVVAECEGGKETLRYILDGFDEEPETLLALQRRQLRGSDLRQALFPVVLSDQPVGRDRRDTLPPWFVLSDVALEVTASDGKDVSVLATEMIVPQRRPLSLVRMDLESRTFA